MNFVNESLLLWLLFNFLKSFFEFILLYLMVVSRFLNCVLFNVLLLFVLKFLNIFIVWYNLLNFDLLLIF